MVLNIFILNYQFSIIRNTLTVCSKHLSIWYTSCLFITIIFNTDLLNIGKLIHLYIDEIEPGDGIDAPEFLISVTAKFLNKTDGKNWISVIVKEVGKKAISSH